MTATTEIAWEAMTPRERDATIHHQVFGGHVEHGRIPCPDNKPGCLVIHYGYLSDGSPILHYTTDQTAVRLVDDEIERRGLQEPYIQALDKLVTYEHESGWVWFRWGILRATPEQRCQAAVIAIRGVL